MVVKVNKNGRQNTRNWLEFQTEIKQNKQTNEHIALIISRLNAFLVDSTQGLNQISCYSCTEPELKHRVFRLKHGCRT